MSESRDMRLDFAPMEGITGYIYRNAHHDWFGGVERYFSPFLSPGVNKGFSPREEQDICREHNQKIRLVPQILSNQAENFLLVTEKLAELGYEEVNLNLGCPSGTVVAKKKGSGFLAYPEELQYFLEEIFAKSPLPISIKTRIGKESPEEFGRLLEIFNAFPIKELIVHPRVQRDMYKNTPNWEVFEWGLQNSRNPVCYNGDINSLQDYERLRERFKGLEAAMLGRGLLRNPFLAKDIQKKAQKTKENLPIQETRQERLQALRGFHEQVYQDYKKVMSGERNVLFKMKEIWFYLAASFPESEKECKKIKKAESCLNYERAVDAVFLRYD
ncbi:MAG: tRNA-dihydrouridine synthase family protein [bacterium]|nr:tRNA-dihydrouridine synthase family protein [bacterium]